MASLGTTVVETEGVIPDNLQRDFNRALTPNTMLRNLESLAMVVGKQGYVVSWGMKKGWVE